MPLVHIHLIKGSFSTDQLRLIADAIQTTMESHFNAPPHETGTGSSRSTSLGRSSAKTPTLPGLPRSEKLVVVQIFQQGRSAGVKQAAYAEMMRRLREGVALQDGDLIVSVAANTRGDWSFGAGRAQFLTGEL